MPKQYQIQPEAIEADKFILLDGTLEFSRLARQIADAELVKTNQRRESNGLNPIDRAHTTVTLSNVRVHAVAEDGVTPRTQLTLEEQFVQERFYTSDKHPELGLQYTALNTTRNLPVVAQLNEAGIYDPITLTGDLASKIPVRIVLRTFRGNRRKGGVNLDNVLIQQTGEVPYYRGNGSAANLQAAGVVFSTAPQTRLAADAVAAAPAAPVQAMPPDEIVAPPAAVVQPPVIPAAMPTPVPAPAPAPVAPAAPSAGDQAAALAAAGLSPEQIALVLGNTQAPAAGASPFNNGGTEQGPGVAYNGPMH